MLLNISAKKEVPGFLIFFPFYVLKVTYNNDLYNDIFQVNTSGRVKGRRVNKLAHIFSINIFEAKT